jgi:hypothetical protein
MSEIQDIDFRCAKKSIPEVVTCTKYQHLLGEGEKLIFGAHDFLGYSCNN